MQRICNTVVSHAEFLWESFESIEQCSKNRFDNGLLVAPLTAFCTYAFLELTVEDLHMEPAMVLLFLLVITGAFVGLCLGVLLPVFFSGAVFGGSLGLVIITAVSLLLPEGILYEAAMSPFLSFAVIGALLAAVGAGLSVG